MCVCKVFSRCSVCIDPLDFDVCVSSLAMQANDGADLDTQLACKEKEWKELQTLRVQQQDMSLRDAQEQLSLLRERFQQLKEDFCFNLAVLEERDRELERYDAMAARAQATETARSIIQSNVFYKPLLTLCVRESNVVLFVMYPMTPWNTLTIVTERTIPALTCDFPY